MPKHRPNSKTIICTVVLAAVILAVLTFVYVRSNTAFSSRHITLDTTAGMTKQQRIDDFEKLCEHIESQVPFIYDYEELYGISFESTKNYYSEIISNTTNDFEYYALVQGLINNIPSGHLTIGYPNPSFIHEPYTYRTNEYTEFSSACNYWENLIKTECEKHYDEDYYILPFYYTNGEYIQSSNLGANYNSAYGGAELVSVNNVPIDEFIKLCPLEYKLKFDHQNKKPFREVILFNNLCGNECTIQYKDKNGELLSEKMYYGTSGSIVLNYIDYFRSIDDPQTDESTLSDSDNRIYTYYDIANNAVYFKFNDFTYGGAEALKELDKADIPDNIIIDLRDNTGGMMGVCDALIEKLSDRSFNYDAKVYFTSDENCYDESCIERRAAELPFETRFKKLYMDIREENFEGKSERKHNIYVLVSHITLSAADRFVSIIKDNDLGTVIGAFNTGGEAYGSPDIKVLETSGIYFYFTPYKSLNKNGTDNSVYGTSPNVYVSINKETLNKRNEIIVQGIDYSTYENRLKWDNVLIETLELIRSRKK
ncbi:MAG: S41 family peptidase [Oscillospiraceae bacterium]